VGITGGAASGWLAPHAFDNVAAKASECQGRIRFIVTVSAPFFKVLTYLTDQKDHEHQDWVRVYDYLYILSTPLAKLGEAILPASRILDYVLALGL
jgi:hypothetical protein